MIRVRRRRRHNLLRTKLQIRGDRLAASAVLAELALIHKSPRLTGNTKHVLFMRGAAQLKGLL